MLDDAKALLLQLGYDIDALEASTNRATGVVDAGTGKMVSRMAAAARQINAEFGKVSAEGVRASFAQIAKLQDHLVDATTAGEKGIAAALRAQIDVRERVQRAAIAQLDTQLAIAKATGNSAQVRELQQVLALYQQIQKQRAVGVAGSVGLAGAEGVVDALSGGGHGGSGGLNRMQMMELGHSARATFDALAAGASPMRVLAMEGPRVVQALGSGEGGVAGVLKGLASSIGPVALTFGLLGAALAAGVISAVQYVSHVREIETALAGVGRASGATVGQVQAIAEAQAKAGTITQGGAEKIEAALLTTGRVTSENLSEATTVVREFAEVTHTKLTEASKDMAKAFADPAKGAHDLGVEFGLLGEEQVKEIERIQKHEGRAAALKKLLEDLDAELKRSGSALSDHAEGWAAVATAIGSAWENLGKYVALAAGLAGDNAKLTSLKSIRDNYASSGDASLQAQLPDLDNQIAALQAKVDAADKRALETAARAQKNRASIEGADDNKKHGAADQTAGFDKAALDALNSGRRSGRQGPGRLGRGRHGPRRGGEGRDRQGLEEEAR
jgi:phage-related minor tail protein